MCGYLYILQTKSDKFTNKIKIGRTASLDGRFKSMEYKNCVVIQISYVSDDKHAETVLKEEFDKKFLKVPKHTEFYLIDDISEGLKIFNNVVKQFIITNELLKNVHKEKEDEENELIRLSSSATEDSSDDICELKGNIFKDFSQSDTNISIVNGSISFIYEDKKQVVKPRDIKNHTLSKFQTDKVRLHENKIYIFKPGRLSGWYYVGPKFNKKLIEELYLKWTPESFITLNGSSSKNKIYTLTNE